MDYVSQRRLEILPSSTFCSTTGDDDLLEILGQSTNTSVIQSHLKKLFAGIYSVGFDEDEVRAYFYYIYFYFSILLQIIQMGMSYCK